jgi:hypothetical protein
MPAGSRKFVAANEEREQRLPVSQRVEWGLELELTLLSYTIRQLRSQLNPHSAAARSPHLDQANRIISDGRLPPVPEEHRHELASALASLIEETQNELSADGLMSNFRMAKRPVVEVHRRKGGRPSKGDGVWYGRLLCWYEIAYGRQPRRDGVTLTFLQTVMDHVGANFDLAQAGWRSARDPRKQSRRWLPISRANFHRRWPIFHAHLDHLHVQQLIRAARAAGGNRIQFRS